MMGTKLESGIYGDTDAEHIMCSIAFSLKRIADAIGTRPDGSNPMAQAITEGIHFGAQQWIGAMINR